MNACLRFLLLLLLGALIPVHSARAILVEGDSADRQVEEDGSLLFAGNPSVRAGRQNAEDDGQNFVLVFQLPDLAGETISTADLQFSVNGDNNFGESWNLDLYGVRSNTASTVLAGDYFEGALDTSATRIQDNILSQFETTGIHNTNTTGDANLASWLQSLYDGGATAGEYAFLRFNHDIDPTANSRYFSFDTADAASSAAKPLLTIETVAVPEPSAFLFGGLICGVLGVNYAHKRNQMKKQRAAVNG